MEVTSFLKVDATRLERTLRSCIEYSAVPTPVTRSPLVEARLGSDPIPSPESGSTSSTSSHPLVPVANKLARISPAASKRFDFVVFAFPHCGQQHVTKNRALLKNFFDSAFKLLAKNINEGEPLVRDWTMVGGTGTAGELAQVHVILKDSKPYSSWEMSDQAKQAGFRYLYKKPFSISDFPGYVHQRTVQDHVPFDASNDCYRFIYSLDAHTVRSRANQALQGKGGFQRHYSTTAFVSRTLSLLRQVR